MSYILQALQKAAAERQRGQVPVLSTALPHASVETAPHAGTGRRRWWLALLALVPVMLALWWWLSASSPASPAPVADAPARSVLPPPAVPAQDSTPETILAPTEAERVLDVQTALLRPAPAPVADAPAAPTPSPSQANAQAPTPAMPGDAASLRISGSTYSDNPLHRMLIINGQVVREGQEVQPGTTLEAIGRHSAIFNQRGRRFNLNY